MNWKPLQDVLERYPWADFAAGAVAVLVACIVSYYVARKVILRGVEFFAKHSKTKWDDALVEHGVFSRLAWMAPAVVVYYAAFSFSENTEAIAQRLVLAYMAILLIGVANSTLSATQTILQSDTDVPIKGYIQIGKLLVVLIGAILVISTVVGQSPWGILSGLGAVSAVLMLVFKDTILSFVASIQIATTGMVKVGDWISMPQYNADGDVIDISLPRVLVQNWDKTITYIPTHKFLDEAFTNWRGMSEAGGRRIKRALQIDQNSVHFLTDEDRERLSKIKLLKPHIDKKTKELQQANSDADIGASPVNGRRLTNIGCLRAYMIAYLQENPKIHDDMTFLVRQLPPSPEGVPLEIYVFSNDIAWAAYEGIQGDIFDHLLAAIPQFGLRVFQNPTGMDFERIHPDNDEAKAG